MSQFQNTNTNVVVSVADEKDDRFGEGWVPYPPAKDRAKAKSSK